MSSQVTVRVAQEIVSHEAIVREAYLDSVGVWTWSVGITNSSGHTVFPRYKDNPQTIRRCLEVFEWVLRKTYVPAVAETFDGSALTEEQFGAALSFHYNTGGIRRATWVKRWKAGDIAAARTTFMNWSRPPAIIPRRRKERDLFFDGVWSSDGTTTVFPVRKPSYQPDWGGAENVDIGPVLEDLLGLSDGPPVAEV
ncbi:glycoside hydrolase family protein [Anderseniella sp. Alg231-50]|uniref:glycoside hydrolase family protein n=1 Tax=Anderseniella sp. Alg231-50 TaxID=1922226 RepID=UPI000D558AB9